MTNSDTRAERFMREALIEAEKAAALNEVPVGAVVVLEGAVIGRGYNQPISSCDPTAHAEVMALKDAAKCVANYRLPDAELYVTIEPCTMCTGAIIHSRVSSLIYGAPEPKAGVIRSQMCLTEKAFFNHAPKIQSGVLEEECIKLVQSFFKRRRAEKKALKQLKDKDLD